MSKFNNHRIFLQKFIWVFLGKAAPMHFNQSEILPQSQIARKPLIGLNLASPM